MADNPPGEVVKLAYPVAPRRIRVIVRIAVAEVAPEEIPLLDALGGMDERHVLGRLAAGGRRGEALGFGMGEAAALAYPVLWLALSAFVQDLANGAATGLSGQVRKLLRRALRRPPAEIVPAPLTLEQITVVCDSVLEAAREHGWSENRARLVRDSLARILIAPPVEPPRAPGQLPDQQPPPVS